MATSGNSNFTINRNDILKTAYQRMGVLSPGESMEGYQVTEGALALNLMTKEWQADGLNLWATQYAYMFLNKTQKVYSISSSGDHATTSFIETAMRVAAVATDTTMEVDSTASMTAGDYIGIVATDGEIQWTTIASITDTDTLELSVGLTTGVAIDAQVYTYTTKMNRPMKIVSAYHHQTGGTDTTIKMIERATYDLLSVKDASGQIVQLYYDPQLGTGKLYVWPTSDNEADYLVLTVQRNLEDFDAATDNADFPIEWGEALIWNLAYKLSFQYGVPLQNMNTIKLEAYESKGRAAGFDREFESVSFAPDYLVGE